MKVILLQGLNGLFAKTPVLAVLLLTAVIAACASDDSKSSDSTSPPSTTTPPPMITANCVFTEDNGTQDCGLIALPQVFNSNATYNITVGKETTIGFGELGLSNFTFTQIINGNISDPKVVTRTNNQIKLLANATALNLNISGIDDNVFGEFYIDIVQHNNTRVKVRYTISITAVNDAPAFLAVRGSESQFDATATPARYDFADIPFNSTIGYSVGNVSTTDVDSDTISYSISGETNVTNLFQISSTGEITLKKVAVNSGNSPIEYTFNVTASDGNDGSVTTEITVMVLTDNQAPMFSAVSGAGSQFASASTDGTTPASYRFDGIPFNSAIDYPVGNVLATDTDGDTISYNISGGTDDTALFQINQDTGAITLKAQATNSGNSPIPYTFNVIANDGQGGTATATISVEVLPDQAPVFTQMTYDFNLLLSAADAGGVVGNVSAIDVEGTPFDYSLTGSNAIFEDLFELADDDNADGNRGIILRRAATLSDFAVFPITFKVVATQQGNIITSDADITVNLINDLQPNDDFDGDGVKGLYDAFPHDATMNITGSGEPNDPYNITNIYQLQAIAGVDHTGMPLDSSDFTNNSFLYGADAADQLTKHYKLANNIDASNTTDTAVWVKPMVGSNNFIGHGWTPIAGGSGQSFSGSFTGDGYHIHNLNMNLQVANNKDIFGLFGVNRGNISAVGLTNINMQIAAIDDSNSDDASFLAGGGETETFSLGSGALVGTNNEGGSIKYAYSTGRVNVDGLYTGGLVGVNIGKIVYSYSTVNVTGRRYTGGLVGVFGVPVTTSPEISSSYATGNVTTKIRDTENVGPGGLVGAMAERSSNGISATINASYAGNAKESVKFDNEMRGGGVGGPLIGLLSTGYNLDISYSFWTNSTLATEEPKRVFFHPNLGGIYTLDASDLLGNSAEKEITDITPAQFMNCGLDECVFKNPSKLFPSPHWDPNLDDPGIERGWIFEIGKYPALYANRTLNSVTTSLMPSLEAQDCHRIQVSDACGTYDAVE